MVKGSLVWPGVQLAGAQWKKRQGKNGGTTLAREDAESCIPSSHHKSLLLYLLAVSRAEATIGNKIVEIHGSKIRFSSVLKTFPLLTPYPQTVLIFLFLDCTYHRAFETRTATVREHFAC